MSVGKVNGLLLLLGSYIDERLSMPGEPTVWNRGAKLRGVSLCGFSKVAHPVRRDWEQSSDGDHVFIYRSTILSADKETVLMFRVDINEFPWNEFWMFDTKHAENTNEDKSRVPAAPESHTEERC